MFPWTGKWSLVSINDCIEEAENTMRIEHDFLGEKEVPDDVLYGVQTLRALDNFQITGQHLDHEFIAAIAKVKKAAALRWQPG